MTNATQEPTIGAEVREIALEICHPNPWNKERPTDEGFLQSLRDNGQIVIALVRPHPTIEGEYQVIFGDRRRRGLIEIGNSVLMAEIREMDDREAEDLCAIENAQRVGLGWQQQCELIQDYLARHQDDDAPARIGSAMGISTAQVKRRARILAQLSPSWGDMLKTGELHTWTLDHLEVLTVFGEKFQENLHKRLHYNANSLTVAGLKEEIADESKALKSAPWDLDDVALLPKAGACTGCAYRSDAQADLFVGNSGGTGSNASCLDGACFGKKMQAYTKRKEAELLEKHPEAVKVAADYNTGVKDALRPGSYTEAKKSDKGAVPAIVHGGNGKVSLAYVKVKKEAKPASEKDLAKEAARKKEARITALAIEKLITIVRDSETKFHDDARDVLVQFCLVYGGTLEIEEEDQPQRVRAYAKKPATVAELWTAAIPEIDRQLNRAKWALENGRHDGDENPTVALVAWLVEADFSELLEEAKADIEKVPAPSEEGVVPGTVNVDDEWEGSKVG